MKLYKIVLTDKREELVQADSYSEIDDRFIFFRDGTPIPDVFILSSAVLGIFVASDNIERDSVPVTLD